MFDKILEVYFICSDDITSRIDSFTFDKYFHNKVKPVEVIRATPYHKIIYIYHSMDLNNVLIKITHDRPDLSNNVVDVFEALFKTHLVIYNKKMTQQMNEKRMCKCKSRCL